MRWRGRAGMLLAGVALLSCPVPAAVAEDDGGVSGWLETPLPEVPAATASPKLRDGETNRWWIGVHRNMIRDLQSRPQVDLLFAGDSIVDGFDAETLKGGGETIPGGKAVWDAYYGDRRAFNLGVSGDSTRELLWRLRNGGLDGISPRVVVLTIGHNNQDPPEDLAIGMLAILREIRLRQPQAHILFIPHFPSTKSYWRGSRQRKAFAIAAEAVRDDPRIRPLDLTDAFVNEEDVLKDPALIPDNTHPAEPGYQAWAEAMEPTLRTLLGDDQDR